MIMIDVMLFGSLAEIAGASSFQLEGTEDTDAAIARIERLYPLLAGRRYAVAVDRRVVQANTPLHDGACLALMPPFSGG